MLAFFHRQDQGNGFTGRFPVFGGGQGYFHVGLWGLTYYPAGDGGNGSGGGLFVSGGSVNLTSVTISSNTAQGGSGGNYRYAYLAAGSQGSGGNGFGGGIGGGVYRVGGGVSAPRALFTPDPEYSDEARKAKHQGVVILWAIITPDGTATNIKVARSLGMGLDEKAMDAVKNWRFDPALKDGHPVAVQVNIEVNFRLY